MRLLLVEDDLMIGEVVLDLLRDEGFAVDWVKDGLVAQSTLVSQQYDLVLLDLGLPKMDGIKVLRSMRVNRNFTPVLIATARDAVAQRIEGLNLGADDYIVKPYDLDELLARIRALLRRTVGIAQGIYANSGVVIDSSAREVTVKGSTVVLSSREWAVLDQLLARPGVTLSRKQIEDKLYSWKDEISSNAIEVYIYGLRKKLGNGLIQNVRGVGYVISRSDTEK